MTTATSRCPVCDREPPASPRECRYHRFWNDPAVTRAHSSASIEANERALAAARAEMRRRNATPGPDGTAASPTDVVCIVDRTGVAEEFAERAEILRDLLGLVGKFGELFRVALIECRDHRYAAAVVDEPSVLVHPLGSPEKALAILAEWQPLAAHNDLGAPIEDALAALETLEWRDGAEHVLFTFGARAPHPPRQEEEPWLNCCPLGHDWKTLLADAKETLGLRCVAVRWPRAENALLRLARPREDAWRALGDDGRRAPEDVTSSALVGLLGLTEQALSVGGAG